MIRSARLTASAALLALISGAPMAADGGRWAVAVLPSGNEFSLEVREDPLGRQVGYMFREEVGPREGMLFLFDDSGHHSFWMKNCLVALDIVWLDEGLRVVHIAAERPPCPPEGECPSILPARAARYVLEFAAGTAAREGLRLGDRVIVHADPPLDR